MQPLVSISCITYNQAPYIKDALEGFLSQKTDFAYEILIHDDCSTDGTAEIIRDYASRYPDIIKPLFEEENQYSQGKPIGTMVWNLPRARGKYIAFCEGDDYWHNENKLQMQVEMLEQNPEYGMIYGKVRNYIQSTKEFSGIFGGPSESFEELIVANSIPTPTAIVRKALIESYLKDEASKKRYLMTDYPLWLYIAKNSKIKFIDEELATYYVISGSMSHPHSADKWLKFQKSLFEIQNDFLERYEPANTRLKRQIEYFFMKNVLRQRTLYHPELKAAAQSAIKHMDSGYLKKLFFNICNRNYLANKVLKYHLLRNNKRNEQN